jgi:hypothetical protein
VDLAEYEKQLHKHAVSRGYPAPTREGQLLVYQSPSGVRVEIDSHPACEQRKLVLRSAKVRLTRARTNALATIGRGDDLD